MAQFNKGDRVRVIDDGKTYSTYRHMAELMGVEAQWNKGRLLTNGNVGTVVANAMHENWDEMIYAVKADHGGVFLIGERGITLVERVRPLAPAGSTFKIGQKVRVKDLSDVRAYNPIKSVVEAGQNNCVTPEMYNFSDKVLEVVDHANGGYKLEGCIYQFLPDWLEPVEELSQAQRIEELETVIEILRAEKAELAAKLWDANRKLFKVKEIVQ